MSLHSDCTGTVSLTLCGCIIFYTTRAMILVQHLWKKWRDWDDPELLEDLLTSWSAWEKELCGQEEISLCRCYSSSQMNHPSCRHEIDMFWFDGTRIWFSSLSVDRELRGASGSCLHCCWVLSCPASSSPYPAWSYVQLSVVHNFPSSKLQSLQSPYTLLHSGQNPILCLHGWYRVYAA